MEQAFLYNPSRFFFIYLRERLRSQLVTPARPAVMLTCCLMVASIAAPIVITSSPAVTP